MSFYVFFQLSHKSPSTADCCHAAAEEAPAEAPGMFYRLKLYPTLNQHGDDKIMTEFSLLGELFPLEDHSVFSAAQADILKLLVSSNQCSETQRYSVHNDIKQRKAGNTLLREEPESVHYVSVT